MLGDGRSRRALERVLGAAYADGLLSDKTLSHRLDQLLGARLVDPSLLIGDLTLRQRAGGWRTAARARARRISAWLDGATADSEAQPLLLALDWSGACSEMTVGRHLSCDVVLTNQSVSRRHAQLRFRDGNWILKDLDSTNGTRVNGTRVGRCKLHPGDHLLIGGHLLEVD